MLEIVTAIVMPASLLADGSCSSITQVSIPLLYSALASHFRSASLSTCQDFVSVPGLCPKCRGNYSEPQKVGTWV